MLPHGILFRYFHTHTTCGTGDPPAFGPTHPGSMSAGELCALLRWLGPQRILPAHEWLRRAEAGTLDIDDLCLTFDNGLRCQFDIARPVLRQFGLTAFWFISTSVLEGGVQRRELYRAFHARFFADNGRFLRAFFRVLANGLEAERVQAALAALGPRRRGSGCPPVAAAGSRASDDDRRSQPIRDGRPAGGGYHRLMDALLAGWDRLSAGHCVGPQDPAPNLWIDADCLRRLHAEGHVIGLHSHTHPPELAELPLGEQWREYRQNHAILTEILGEPPATVAHPCNSYNEDTLALLRTLGVRLGFRADASQTEFSELEFPREDGLNVLRAMQSHADAAAS